MAYASSIDRRDAAPLKLQLASIHGSPQYLGQVYRGPLLPQMKLYL